MNPTQQNTKMQLLEACMRYAQGDRNVDDSNLISKERRWIIEGKVSENDGDIVSRILAEQNAQLRELVEAKHNALLAYAQYMGPCWPGHREDAPNNPNAAQKEMLDVDDQVSNALLLMPDDFPAEKKGVDVDNSSHLYPLFKHMATNHNLTLLDSELWDIMRVVIPLGNAQPVAGQKEGEWPKSRSHEDDEEAYFIDQESADMMRNARLVLPDSPKS